MTAPIQKDLSSSASPVYLRVIGDCLCLVNADGQSLGAQISVVASCEVGEVQTVTVKLAHQGYWEELHEL